MKTSKEWLRVGALVLALPVIAGVVVHEAGVAAASCSIGWDGSQPTCWDDVSGSGAFAFPIGTSWGSQYEGLWTLGIHWNYITSDNIEFESVDIFPDEFEVGCEGSFHCSDVEESTCDAVLEEENENGLFSIFAQNLDTANCSGSWSVDIKPNGC